MHLSSHAARGREKDDVGQAVDDVGQIAQIPVKFSGDMTYERKQLDAVVRAHEAVVAYGRRGAS